MFVGADEGDGKVLFLDCKLNLAVDVFCTGIEGAKELVGAAFYFEGDHVVVWDNDGTGIEVVRRYRRDNEAGGLREYDRTSAT